MAVVNYDHAVSYYDATRGYPEGVPEQFRDAIINYVDADTSTQFLELAIGTGIIGIPFIDAGYRYVGVDMSVPMMVQIPSKLQQDGLPQLAQADVTQSLPFPNDTFDVVNAVRVFHLLDDWQSAIDAVKRVLKSNGHLIIAHEAILETMSSNPLADGHNQWNTILEQLGIPKKSARPRLWQKVPAIQTYLQSLGASATMVDLCTFDSSPWSIRMIADQHKHRNHRADWALSDSIHAEAIAIMENWLTTECKNPDQKVKIPMVFRALVARW